MTQLKSFFAIVLMSMMFANVATAQTTTDQSKSATLRITRNNKVITKTTATDTIVAKKTTINQVSDSFKVARYEARLKGEQVPGTYFDNHNKDIEGKLLSRPFVELGGGGNYLPSSKEFRPEVRLTAGWEMKPAIIFADFSLGWKGYSTSNDLTDNGIREGAEAEGRYNIFNGTLNVALKVLQNARYTSYLAIYGGAGYTYAKTDGDSDDIRFSSSFYQFRWQGGIMGKIGINDHWGFTGRIYVQNPSDNPHDSNQGVGKVSYGAQAGVSYSF